MYYDIGDTVRVIDKEGLNEHEFEIKEVSDDEETFQLVKIHKVVDTDDNITLEASRNRIMKNDEIEKLVKWFIKDRIWTLEEASAIDELEAYLKGEESDFVTAYQDETLDGMVMNFDSFSTVDEANKWFKQTFSHYLQSGLYKLDGTYYAIIIS